MAIGMRKRGVVCDVAIVASARSSVAPTRLRAERNICVARYIRKMSYDASWLLMRATAFSCCVVAFSRSLSVATRAVDLSALTLRRRFIAQSRKRERLNQQRSVNLKKPKARALIGKPNQSDVSVAPRLREASERLSSNRFPSAAQLIDVTNPEPIRMDFDASMISPATVAAPEAIDAPAPTPAPPPARRALMRLSARFALQRVVVSARVCLRMRLHAS